MYKKDSFGTAFSIRTERPAAKTVFPKLFFPLLFAAGILAHSGRLQAAVINSTWWTYQQDCNGDGSWAGQLAGNLARLNWTPAAANCSGNVTVYEIIYSKACASNTWTALYTNAPHPISGCSFNNSQYYDITLGSNSVCHDYKIELYKSSGTPDWVESPTNDANLSQHKEQLLSQDFCLSDYFATAEAVSGATGSRVDDNTFATKEPGEPDHAGNPGGKSLWFDWTAPTNKQVIFDTLGSSFDTLLAVYTGSSISNLSPVATNDDISGASNRFSRVTFKPTTGTTYHIAVDGFGGASGFAQLNWNQSGVNLPDLIVWGPTVASSLVIITNTFSSSDCEVVEGCEPVGTRTLLSFTTETRNIGTGDLVMGDPSTNALFHWAVCHQHYHFEQFASYSLLNTNVLDTNGNPVLAASGHKVGFCLEDVIKWSPSAPNTIRYNCTSQGIQAGWADIYYGYDYYPPPNDKGLPCQYIDITGVAPGDYILQIVVNPDNVLLESDTNNNVTLVPVNIPPATCSAVPANDKLANALVVTDLPFTYSEPNECASKQSGEPNHAGNAGGHSVWFEWVAPASQTVVVNTKGSTFDTLLGVYTGNSVSTLSLVASNDDIIYSALRQSQVSFGAVAGVNYYIAVDGFAMGGTNLPATGNVVLNMAPPVNDDFQNGLALQGTAGSTNGYNLGGSKQPYEPAHAGDVGGHSIWYHWTAPTNGPVDFNTIGSTFDTTLAIYTGGTYVATNGAITNLTPVVSCHNDPEAEGGWGSRADFTAVKGTTYELAIDGFGGATGNIILNWNMDSHVGITTLLDGSVQMSLTGVDWQRYVLQASTNMLGWSTEENPITMAHGIHDYDQITSTNTGTPRALFFRGVLAH